jgi:hypothetical protein
MYSKKRKAARKGTRIALMAIAAQRPAARLQIRCGAFLHLLLSMLQVPHKTATECFTKLFEKQSKAAPSQPKASASRQAAQGGAEKTVARTASVQQQKGGQVGWGIRGGGEVEISATQAVTCDDSAYACLW